MIQLLIKPASGMCNLRCSYCFYCDEMKNRKTRNYGFMSEKTLENLVKRAFENEKEFCGFAFQGGEPTLCGLDFFEKFIALEKKYNVGKISVFHSIQTNGFALSEKWADFFVRNKFLVGVSLDGMRATHDTYRKAMNGKGSFESILDTISLFERKGVSFNILTVVNAITAKNISSIYSFYKERGWNYFQFIPCLDPLMEKQGIRNYSLKPEIYGEFLVKLFELWYADVKKGKMPYIREFENYIGMLLGYEPELCSQRGHCSIQLVVEADGSVYPCDFYVTDKYNMGNIENYSINELRRRGLELGFVQESMKKPRECMECPYGFLCRGGCRRMCVVDSKGNIGINYFCKSYKQLFEATLPRFKELARLAYQRMRNYNFQK